MLCESSYIVLSDDAHVSFIGNHATQSEKTSITPSITKPKM